MKQLLALVLGAVLLAGCAPAYTYTKSGATAQDWHQDNYACVQESRTSFFGAGAAMIIGGAIGAKRQAAKLYDMCMLARGWEHTDAQ